mmetsp:Transcript_30178/g.59750  ORF Transcript_30178/g.59750 Transcript_30178/m.59750 type:complete len:264 (+) Transcript_30178:1830-2621(+)
MQQIKDPEDSRGHLAGVDRAPDELFREGGDREEEERDAVPFEDAFQGQDAAEPGPLFEKGLGGVLQRLRDGLARLLDRDVSRLEIIVCRGGIGVVEALAGPEEFVEIVVISFFLVVDVGLHTLADNLIDGRDDVVQEVALVQGPRVGDPVAAVVGLHHFVEQKPGELRHVSEVAPLAPDAEVKNQVEDHVLGRPSARHRFVLIRSTGHTGKNWPCADMLTPLSVVVEYFIVEGYHWRYWPCPPVVTSMVGQKAENVLSLIPHG